MQDQLISFEFDTIDQTNAADLAKNQLELNITNAIEKLDKYQQLLTLPVYLASVVLMPWYKQTYFEDTLNANNLGKAYTKVQRLQEDSYASGEVETDDRPPSESQSKKVCLYFLI